MNDVSFLQKDDNLIDALNELKQNWLSVINHTNTKDKEIFVYKVLKDSTNNNDIYEEFIRSELSVNQLTKKMRENTDSKEPTEYSYKKVIFESDIALVDVVDKLNNYFEDLKLIDDIEYYEPYSFKGWHSNCTDFHNSDDKLLLISYNKNDNQSFFLYDGGGWEEKKGWNFNTFSLSHCLVKRDELSWNSQYNLDNDRILLTFRYK